MHSSILFFVASELTFAAQITKRAYTRHFSQWHYICESFESDAGRTEFESLHENGAA